MTALPAKERYNSLQEVFDVAYTGIAAQGFKQSIGNTGCAYRGEDGMKCAIGHCIPDAAYRPTIEGKSVHFIMKTGTLGPIFDGVDRIAIARLQTVHDNSMTPEEMKTNLASFALVNRLNVPEV